MRLEDTPGDETRTEREENSLVEDMATNMRRKLAANRHKRHWLNEEVTDAYLIGRLREEVDELEAAVAAGEETWPEAADVANLAAMIADRQ